jgi:hypothetical protein
MKKGTVLLVVGVFALIVVYCLRPPSDIGDAMRMMGQGRNYYFKEPMYYTLMVLSAVVAFFGVMHIVSFMRRLRCMECGGVIVEGASKCRHCGAVIERTFEIRCPFCRESGRVRESLLNDKIECPACKKTFPASGART